jgi:hypothetical protein
VKRHPWDFSSSDYIYFKHIWTSCSGGHTLCRLHAAAQSCSSFHLFSFNISPRPYQWTAASSGSSCVQDSLWSPLVRHMSCRWAFQWFSTRGQDKEAWTNKSARQGNELPQIVLVHACEENDSPDKVLLTLRLKLI